MLVFGISFVVSPFWVEQVYFLNQSAQVLLACTMIAASIFLAEHARTDIRRKWYLILLAVLLIQTAFACYQILAMVYITGVAMAFLLLSLREERTLQQQFRWIGYHAAVFIAGFTVYMVVSRLFFMSGGGYLKNQIAWSKTGLTEGLRKCLEAVSHSLGNHPPYYTGMYGIFSILLIALAVWRMVQVGKLKKSGSVMFLLAVLFLIISPYIFVFFYGEELVARIQLVMPFSQGCILYLTMLLFPCDSVCSTRVRRLFAQGIFLLLAAGIYKDTVSHLNYCNRLYYTYDWIFQYDIRMAEKLDADIREAKTACGLDEEYDRILFLGDPKIPYNASCIRGDTIGVSFFQWDIMNTMPNRYRIVYLMRNLGYPAGCDYTVEQITDYNIYFAEYFGEQVDSMPCYPEEGYVQYLEDSETGLEYLAVKLGDEWH